MDWMKNNKISVAPMLHMVMGVCAEILKYFTHRDVQ